MPAAPLPSASDVVLDRFHPAVAAWFRARFAAPTPAQVRAWPAIQAGRHTLIAAPTGSGKTLAAFLAAIDELDAMALRQNYHLFARGASEILKLPDFQDVSRISAILALLEEEESLLRLLESYSLKEGLHVIIGEENAIEEMRDYSLLFDVVDAAGCRMILGLIGPLRMDYEGSIATLEAISKDLREDHM